MIDLSHLTEEEQGAIMAVLRRDAELKRAEEERISESESENTLKFLSGEWFYEAKSRRHTDKIHGSEIILASIKQRSRGNGWQQYNHKILLTKNEKPKFGDKPDQSLLIGPLRENLFFTQSRHVDVPLTKCSSEPTKDSASSADGSVLQSYHPTAERQESDTEVFSVTMDKGSKPGSSVKSPEISLCETQTELVFFSPQDTHVQPQVDISVPEIRKGSYVDFNQGGHDLHTPSKPQRHHDSSDDITKKEKENTNRHPSRSPKRKKEASSRRRGSSRGSSRQGSPPQESTQEKNQTTFFQPKAPAVNRNLKKSGQRFSKSEYDLRSVGQSVDSDEGDGAPVNQNPEKKSPNLSSSRTQFHSLLEFWDDAASHTRKSRNFNELKSDKSAEPVDLHLPSQDLKSGQPEIYPLSSTVEKPRPAVRRPPPSPKKRSKSPQDRQLYSGTKLTATTDGKNTLSGSVWTVYSPDFGNVEVQGSIHFSINYVQRLREFHVFVAECRDLAAVDPKKRRSDPYVKSYLLPDKANLGKRKTSVKKKTLNPKFNEILRYRVRLEELRTLTLLLSVWHNDTFGRNSFLGEVDVDLSTWDFNHNQMNDLVLRARMKLAVRFLPQISVAINGANTGELHIWVKECQNLPLIRTSIDPYVKCFVLPDTSRKSRQKTRVLKRTVDPVFNHTMVYDGISESDLNEACVELTVWDRDGLNSSPLGGLRLGVGTGKSYGAPVDWMDSTPYEVALWERMMASPDQWVEGVLLLRSLHSAKTALK
uniref:Synaptotagmin-like 2b n=1 Tax=Cynoglossus semilaevis TaxID=244447 RepID=A0A3P8W7A1_CYNSE